MTYYDQVKEAADAVKARVRELPRIAVVLGSGLGDFAQSLEGGVSMPYDELPNWPASHVVGHEGRLVVGTVRGRTIAALAGRSHVYEGHDLKTVTFAVRVLGLRGPSYETPAEIRYLRKIGVDAVGMSTVPEAIVARHMGIEVLGISCISNMAAGVLPQPLEHAEVMETTRQVRGQFIALLEGIIGRL